MLISGGDVDEAFFAAGLLAWEGSFRSGEKTRVEVGVSEDLVELG